MLFAAQATAALASGPTRHIHAHGAMELRWNARSLDSEDLVVAASISGRTPRTLEAMRLARARGAQTLALTDDESSPLAQEANRCLVLGTADTQALQNSPYPGYRQQLAQTQTFLATLFAEVCCCRWVFEGDCHFEERARRWSDRVQQVIERCLGPLDRAVTMAAATHAQAEVSGLVPQVRILGSGPYATIARYGAAKFVEFAIPAAAQCIEEFHHLDVFLLPPGSWVLVLALDTPSRQRVEELLESWQLLGLRIVVLTDGEPWEGPGEFVSVGGVGLEERLLGGIVALQLLVTPVVQDWPRDIEAWLGGVRVELQNRISQQAVRGSRVWEENAPSGDGP